MWDVFFSKLIGRGLIEVLPVVLASLFVAYKSTHPSEKPENKDNINDEYAAGRLQQRSIVKKSRLLHLLLFLVILPATFATLSVFIKGLVGYHEPGDWALLFILFFLLLCIPILLREPYAKNLTGHISTRSTDYLLKTIIPYSFFLRAFHTDNYSEKSTDLSLFSEDILANSLRRRLIRFYSIGNPREIDSPSGSTRVYSVKDWETDVERIIHRNKAKHIYFRVSSSEGCFKEFKMLQDVLDKTTLIVDRLGFPDYLELQKNYPYLPDIEPITEGFVYFLHRDGIDKWIINKSVNTGVVYVPYPAKNRHSVNPETIGYFRDRLLKIIGAIVIICVIGFIMSNSKEKRAKEAWIEANITTCPIVVDSILTIQRFDFPLSGLNIEVSVSDSAKQSITEEQAVLSFFHLCQYDLGKVRDCYKIIKNRDSNLCIMIKSSNDLQPTFYEYHYDEEFDRLWSICKQIEQQRIEKQKEVEASDPSARVKRIHDSLKETMSRNLAY